MSRSSVFSITPRPRSKPSPRRSPKQARQPKRLVWLFKLKDEAAKAANETAKLIAQIAIESANRVSQQSQNVKQFLDDTEAAVEQIADAQKKNIEIDFAQKRVGATPAALEALNQQKSEQLKQVEINKSKQLQEQFLKAVELTTKAYNDQITSVENVTKADRRDTEGRPRCGARRARKNLFIE
jgi:hypothetical protein